MLVKHLKEALDRIPEDTEVLLYDEYGRPVPLQAIGPTKAVLTKTNPPWHHQFVMTVDQMWGPRACAECGQLEEAHRPPPGLMADSDRRQFLIVDDGPGTPQHLKDNSFEVVLLQP